MILWLCNPNYIRDVVVPCVREGRERAGKTLEGFDIIAAVPSALTEDVGPSYDAMRRDLLPYFGLPFYRAMLERSGFAADIAALRRGRRRPGGDGRGDLRRVPRRPHRRRRRGRRARPASARYLDAGATSPCIGPIPKTDFAATLRAGAPEA